MRIKVRLFARLREELGQGTVDLELSESSIDVRGAIAELARRHGENWSRALNAPHVLCAVNFRASHVSASLKDGDEIAFYPPVSGG